MNKRLLLVTAVTHLLLCIQTTTAQTLTLSLPFVNNAVSGQTVDLPVRVSNFKSIVTAQFVIRWDPKVLQLKQVDQIGLPRLDTTQFNLTQAKDSGILRMVWWRNSSPVTLADNSVIFRLRMNVVGPKPSGTPVSITELPPPGLAFEISNEQGDVYKINQVTLKSGFVAVGYTVGVDAPNVEDAPSLRAYADPFSGSVKADIYLPYSDEIRLSLLDATGKSLILQKNTLVAGKHGIEIASTLPHEAGIYFLVMETKHTRHISKFFSH